MRGRLILIACEAQDSREREREREKPRECDASCAETASLACADVPPLFPATTPHLSVTIPLHPFNAKRWIEFKCRTYRV